MSACPASKSYHLHISLIIHSELGKQQLNIRLFNAIKNKIHSIT